MARSPGPRMSERAAAGQLGRFPDSPDRGATFARRRAEYGFAAAHVHKFVI